MAETSRNEKHREKRSHQDAEEIREILAAVSETVPNLISSLFTSIFNEKAAEALAVSIGTLYTKLKEQGLPEDMIEQIVESYISLIPSDLGDLLSETKMGGHSQNKAHHKHSTPEPSDNENSD